MNKPSHRHPIARPYLQYFGRTYDTTGADWDEIFERGHAAPDPPEERDFPPAPQAQQSGKEQKTEQIKLEL